MFMHFLGMDLYGCHKFDRILLDFIDFNDFNRSVWICIDFDGFVWICVNLYRFYVFQGFVWLGIAFHDLHEFSMILVGFHGFD